MSGRDRSPRFSGRPSSPIPLASGARRRLICLIACWFGIGPMPSCSSAMIGCRNSVKILADVAAFARASMPCNPEWSCQHRLLQRQISLLEYLTSADAIFGKPRCLRSHLQEFDQARCGLKRASRMKTHGEDHRGVPRTFELLGGDKPPSSGFRRGLPLDRHQAD